MMERRKGGCCLAPRYDGAAGQSQAWHMGNIMLKFRPIAPKPAAMAPPAPVPAPVGAVGAAKGKRKAVAGGGGTRRGRKPKKAATTVALVTAAAPKVDVQNNDKPLLSSPSSSSSVDSSTPPPPPVATLLHAPSPEKQEGFSAAAADLAPARVVRALRPVASSTVTLESVTGTWRDGEAPSAAACCSDDAPAFVSDQWGRVAWMNLAFNRAVYGGGGNGDAATAPSASDAGVVLAAKDGAAVPAWGTCAGFTCRVRVTYGCPRRASLVAPCDVWRLDAGSYLWRLDLQATLTLSLGGLLLSNPAHSCVRTSVDQPNHALVRRRYGSRIN